MTTIIGMKLLEPRVFTEEELKLETACNDNQCNLYVLGNDAGKRFYIIEDAEDEHPAIYIDAQTAFNDLFIEVEEDA